MHLPSTNKLLLILPASTCLSPTAPVLTNLSLPAKSTTLNLDTPVPATCSAPLSPFGTLNTLTVNTACDRELSPLLSVAYVARFARPWARTSRISAAERIGCSRRPAM